MMKWGKPYDEKIAELAGKPGYAGLDLSSGKQHPIHLAVLKRDIVSPVLYQVASVWVDPPFRIAPTVDYLIQVCGELGVAYLAYDATRPELQMMQERGELPQGWEPVVFTMENKYRLAGALHWALQRRLLKVLPDQRQHRSVQQVDYMLQATEVPGLGHGDSFWSLALAVSIALERPEHTDLLQFYGLTPSPESVLALARERHIPYAL